MQDTPPFFGNLPAVGYVRQAQLVVDPKRPEKPAILPFSAATLWRKVKSGEFPRPVKLSERVTAWPVAAVRAWMEKCEAQHTGASKGGK